MCASPGLRFRTDCPVWESSLLCIKTVIDDSSDDFFVLIEAEPGENDEGHLATAAMTRCNLPDHRHSNMRRQ